MKLLLNIDNETFSQLKVLSTFDLIRRSIVEIQSEKLSLQDQLLIYERVRDFVEKNNTNLFQRFQQVFFDNSELINVENPRNWFMVDRSLVNLYGYAPLTTCCVERSFSKLTRMITKEKSNLSKKSLIIQHFIQINAPILP